MKSLKHLAALLALAVLVATGQAQAETYVIIKGKKEKADRIEANASGGLTLISGPGGGAKRTVQWADMDRVVTDKPAEIRTAEDQFNNDKFDDVLKTLNSQVFSKYRYVGWGAYISHLRGRSYLALKQPAEAQKVLNDGMRYAAKEDREGLLNIDMVQALIDQGDKQRVEKAKEIMATVNPGNDANLAAFLYNMQGKLLRHDGKKREALLKHLAVIMVFEKADRAARMLAYDEAIELMQELNDARHGYLTTKKNAEFR